MVAPGSAIPGSPNQLNRISSRPERVDSANRNEPSSRSESTDSDRFEPSEELAAREAEQAGSGATVNLNTEDQSSQSAPETGEDAILSRAHAADVVNETGQQITFNAQGAILAQGNLVRENVVNLLA